VRWGWSFDNPHQTTTCPAWARGWPQRPNGWASISTTVAERLPGQPTEVVLGRAKVVRGGVRSAFQPLPELCQRSSTMKRVHRKRRGNPAAGRARNRSELIFGSNCEGPIAPGARAARSVAGKYWRRRLRRTLPGFVEMLSDLPMTSAGLGRTRGTMPPNIARISGPPWLK